MTATALDGIELTIDHGGVTHHRVYRLSDSKDSVIVLGRLSSTDVQEHDLSDGPGVAIGGAVVSPGRASFISPVMSRQHARLVFSDETVYEPLSAKVRIITTDAPVLPSHNSFTGHGYTLPPNIDDDFMDMEDDPEVFKDDNEEVEDPSTHKHYTEVELADEDEHAEELDSSEIESVPSPLIQKESQLVPSVITSPEASLSFGSNSAPRPLTPHPFSMAPQYPISLFPSDVPPLFAAPPWRQNFFPGMDFPIRPAAPPPLNPVHSFISITHNHNPIPPLFHPLPPPINEAAKPRNEIEPINLDAPPPPQEVIDVDAVGSPDIDASSPLSPMVTHSSDDEDSDVQFLGQKSAHFEFDESGMSSEDDEDIRSLPSPEPEKWDEDVKELTKSIRTLTEDVKALKSYQSHSKRRIKSHKNQVDAKVIGLQDDLASLRSLVKDRHDADLDAEGHAKSTVERKKEEILEDLSQRKREFLTDLDGYESDVTYEVNRVMDSVDDLALDIDQGRDRLAAATEAAQTLREDTTRVAADVDAVRKAGEVAMEEINQVVAGVKRKRDELENTIVAPPVITPTPTVTKVMSESEIQCDAPADILPPSTESNVVEPVELLATTPPTITAAMGGLSDISMETVAVLVVEPPQKRRRIASRAARVTAGLLATTAMAYIGLGMF
ncbi:hypothetical protein FRB99_005791 [Tulasnella sp. 403]|nr:hypothetical protein FRB99_005791 [Tulasnella sp. 403]